MLTDVLLNGGIDQMRDRLAGRNSPANIRAADVQKVCGQDTALKRAHLRRKFGPENIDTRPTHDPEVGFLQKFIGSKPCMKSWQLIGADKPVNLGVPERFQAADGL